MPDVPRFRTIRQLLGPRWLTDIDSEQGLVGYSLDLMKDAFLERVFAGVQIRFPFQDPEGTTAPEDALAAMGRDRRVVRGLNESAASYATRLLSWLDDRKRTGNAFALMQKLAEYTGPGCKFRTVDTRGNWYTREVDGSTSYVLKRANWEWDTHPIDVPTGKARWSRFWVIIYPPATLWTAQPFSWGDVTGPSWGDAVDTWGTTATSDQVRTIQAIVADWKPENARCVNIIVAFDPASFDPSAGVADPGLPNSEWEFPSRNVAGVQVPARLATARYWDGV